MMEGVNSMCCILRTFVNVTMTPSTTIILKGNKGACSVIS
jgi:hypothetical protein